ncbi:MAG: ATP phosphoribosyltransferase regulatory subunit [Gammaproteobacteria bacterium]|nr:MAG: ATP phosphoribosyltransferase regulatory subunit [Gammaproteobacteria bacterium]
MRKERWLLPEGIEEALPPEAEHLEKLRRRLLDLFHRWGYELVMPPLIEYLDSLLVGTGSDLDLQTFKLIDQLTGRLMGVRADMTPQVARIEAHRLKREAPTRLCYVGTVLHTRPEVPGGTRSPLHVGAELYGHAGVESDVEVLRLLWEALKEAGVEGVHLDLGHVGIFRSLVKGRLSQEEESELFDALQRKAKADIRSLLKGAGPWREKLMRLADLHGGEEVLKEARDALGEEVDAPLSALEKAAGMLKRFLPEAPLHFDLAELRGYRYHTGIVFAAYVEGQGQAVAQGGRYDDIGRAFGRARPATGFSLDLKALIPLLSQQPYPPESICAPWPEDDVLESLIRQLRAQGERVIHILPGASGMPGCRRVIAKRGGQWQVVDIEETHG